METRTIFSDVALQKAVDSAMSKIPVGHTFAIVAHADLNGATLTAVCKANDHWTIQAAAIKPWKGPLSAEAEVIASW
jgi:hypothetical protein